MLSVDGLGVWAVGLCNALGSIRDSLQFLVVLGKEVAKSKMKDHIINLHVGVCVGLSQFLLFLFASD